MNRVCGICGKINQTKEGGFCVCGGDHWMEKEDLDNPELSGYIGTGLKQIGWSINYLSYVLNKPYLYSKEKAKDLLKAGKFLSNIFFGNKNRFIVMLRKDYILESNGIIIGFNEFWEQYFDKDGGETEEDGAYNDGWFIITDLPVTKDGKFNGVGETYQTEEENEYC